MHEILVRPGQVWGNAEDTRQLLVEHVDRRFAYCIDLDRSRKTRILLRRLSASKEYYLKHESPARYVEVESESGECTCQHMWEQHLSLGCVRCPCKDFKAAKTYWVWTGDAISPAHCPCEDFRWHKREPMEAYRCKHLKKVLEEEGMS